MVKPLQSSKILAVLIASCSCAYSKLVPTHFCKYLECFKGARTALKCCTQTFMCMLYQTVPQILKETLGAHGQLTATLKDFGRFDCFMQLQCIWSAGPHSFLVNIQNVSRGALH
jgi:hypothetical protein